MHMLSKRGLIGAKVQGKQGEAADMHAPDDRLLCLVSRSGQREKERERSSRAAMMTAEHQERKERNERERMRRGGRGSRVLSAINSHLGRRSGVMKERREEKEEEAYAQRERA